MSNVILAKLTNSRLVIIHASDLQFIAGATMVGQLFAKHSTLTLAQTLAINSLPPGTNALTAAEVLEADRERMAIVPERDCAPPCTTNIPGPIPGVVHGRQQQILDILYGDAIP